MDPLKETRYYQAQGRKIALRPNVAYVAVDLTRLEPAQIASLKSSSLSGLKNINQRLVMIPRRRLDAHQLGELEHARALLPVYSQGGADLVAQPEVRVEAKRGLVDGPSLKSFGQWLGQHEDTVQVVNSRNDRYVLAPRSGYGPDALTLANDIATHFDSLSASPSLIRILPAPMGVGKSAGPAPRPQARLAN